MTIRKKSLTSTLRAHPDAERDVARSKAQPSSSSSEALPAEQTLNAEDVALSKRTVSRILLAKSLFGR